MFSRILHATRRHPGRAAALALGTGVVAYAAPRRRTIAAAAVAPFPVDVPAVASLPAIPRGQAGSFRLFQKREESEDAEKAKEAEDPATGSEEMGEDGPTTGERFDALLKEVKEGWGGDVDTAEEEQSGDQSKTEEAPETQEAPEAEAAQSLAADGQASGTKETIEAAEPHLRRLLAQDFIELKRHFEEELANALAEKDREHAAALEEMRVRGDAELKERIQQYAEHVHASAQAEFDRSIQEESERLHGEFEQHRQKLMENMQARYLEQTEQLLHDSKAKLAKRMKLLSRMNDAIRELETKLSQSEQQAKKDLRSQRLCLALFSLLDASMQSGKPLAANIERVLSESGDHETIHTALKAIPREVAERGVMTRQELSQRFTAVKKVGRREAFVPEGGGVIAQAFAALLAAVTVPETGLVKGNDADAIFARAQYFLDRGDLKEAIDELSNLRGLAAMVTSDFVQAAKERLMVEESIAMVRSYVAQSVAAQK